MTVKNTNKATQVGLLLSYYIVLSFWAAQSLSMTLITRNVAGQTKKSVVVAMNFLCWASGNAIGTYSKPRSSLYPLFRSRQTNKHIRPASLPLLGLTPLPHRIRHTHGLLCPSRHRTHLPTLVPQT